MKRVILISVALFICSVVLAQNNFIYVKYDLAFGKSSALIDYIENIIDNDRGEYIIYYSEGSEPIVAKNKQQWENIRKTILIQQSSPDYYVDIDCDSLNKQFVEWFDESVVNNSIRGKNDSWWDCTFILPKEIIENGQADMIARLISINQLQDRMKVNIISYNDEHLEQISLKEIKTNTIFNYKIGE